MTRDALGDGSTAQIGREQINVPRSTLIKGLFPPNLLGVLVTGFAYLVVGVLMLCIYIGMVGSTSLFHNDLFALTWPANLTGVLLVAALIKPMLAHAQRLANLTIRRTRGNHRRALEIFNRHTKDITDLRLLALTIEQAVTLATDAEDVRLLVPSDSRAQFVPVSERTSECWPPIRLQASSPIVTWMRFHDNPLRREDLQAGSLNLHLPLQEYVVLDNWRIRLLIPVKHREELAGIVVLAAKGSGKPYSKEDLRLLQDELNQIAPWVANARLFAGASSQISRLEQLLERAIRGQEDERKRLAMELHDSPVQRLTGAAYRLEACLENLRRGNQNSANSDLKEAQKSLDTTLEELRHTSAALHPSQLDKVGRVRALASYVDAFERNTGILISLRHNGSIPPMPDPIELAVYRVVQESLSNVRKHAHARNVELQIGLHNGAFAATIKDDGIGFEVDDSRLDDNLHLGLAGMGERAHMLGGTLGIQSTVGAGTQITLLIPDVEALGVFDEDSGPVIGVHRR